MSIAHLEWHEYPPPGFAGGAVSVGNFDGVHRGHAALVRAVRAAERPAVIVTFDPPPHEVLHANSHRPPLTTIAERAELLLAAGAERVVVLKTSAALLALSPEAFFEDVLVRQLGAKAVVEGFNFRFGRGRAGSNDTLRALCRDAGLAFTEVSEQTLAGETLSSSSVRSALEAGDVSRAAQLLGRAYRIAGVVVTGARRGRTLGFPTANLGEVPTLLPANGVYAVRALVGGAVWPAAANVGPNPTFGEDARKIEVHLLGFSGDVYGKPMAVEFAARLRDTRPFAGVAELTAQLQRDIAAAKEALQ
jgi:riboflavin kinase / FMN adenylyltransferase